MDNPKETTYPKTEAQPDVETPKKPTQSINDDKEKLGSQPAVVPNSKDKEHKEPEKKIA